MTLECESGKSNNGITKKKTHIEILRIIAIAFVIFNHTGIEGFQSYTSAQNTGVFWIKLLMAVICKTAVPLFL